MPDRQYIALLRAVNVGGRTVTMERLRTLCSELGLNQVRTFIQSGNVFFTSSPQDRKRLAKKIETHLSGALGYDVPVFVRTIEELEAIVESNPFGRRPPAADERFCVIFTSMPLPADFHGPPAGGREQFRIVKRTEGEALVIARWVSGRPGNPGAYIEKAHDVKTTTRFFHTVVKMLAAAKNQSG